MIDIRKLKELVRLMVENDLTEIDLRDSEEQVTMRRPNAAGVPGAVGQPMFTVPGHVMHVPAASASYSASAAPPVLTQAAANGKPSEISSSSALADDEADLIKIESPMVGTFYATPNPDSQPFASVGTAVAPDKVVCIIEAMKIFNEIKAECTGVIHKVLAKSGEPVEFGQPLFLVKPS